MSIRQTPITYVGTSIVGINSTIAGISTGYANVFGTSNLTIATSFLMSNTTPTNKTAEFYSTSIGIYHGDIIQSNTVYNDGTVSTAPDGSYSLQNTYITACNAGISIVNQPYDPNIALNAYSSNLNSFFLNTNVVIANADSAGVPASGLQYGGIGFGCNYPSFPIDMYIDPGNNPGTVFHGAAISLNDAGLRINSDQLAQINVTTPGSVAEAVFNTTGVGGTIMAYGSGSATRGGYIFASAGDAINIAATGQVSICNAGVAQTAFSLYVGGNAAFNSSFTMCNGDLTIRNSRTQNADFFSTNMTIRNANFTLCNTASVTATATFYSTQVTILNGGFIQSNTAGSLATALFYSTAMTVFGPISTTETLYCLGRFNSPNVANVSTLILGNNIASTAKTSLDINGSLRTRVQFFSTSGQSLSVNNGNLVFFSSGTGSVLFLPSTNSVEIGMQYTMHTESPGTMYLSTQGGDYVNTPGTNNLAIGKNNALVSIMCLGSGAWTAIVTG